MYPIVPLNPLDYHDFLHTNSSHLSIHSIFRQTHLILSIRSCLKTLGTLGTLLMDQLNKNSLEMLPTPATRKFEVMNYINVTPIGTKWDTSTIAQAGQLKPEDRDSND